MEQVLDVYADAYTHEHPLICMDEAAKQLLRDVDQPIPMQPGQPLREDYHYERRGTAAIFMFFDPLRGWRRTSARDNRTRIDWAEEIRQLLEQDYPHASRVTLVCDNLNTHDIASLYQAFPAEQAHRLARRLHIVHTPRQGSWLNMAEIEIAAVQKQCLNRRLGAMSILRRELAAWDKQRNAEACTVKWRFTTADARVRLHRLYPQF